MLQLAAQGPEEIMFLDEARLASDMNDVQIPRSRGLRIERLGKVDLDN